MSETETREHGWTHTICVECWNKQNAETNRIPHAAHPPLEEYERCCYCGDQTRAGIYVRDRLPAKCSDREKEN